MCCSLRAVRSQTLIANILGYISTFSLYVQTCFAYATTFMLNTYLFVSLTCPFQFILHVKRM